MQIVHRQGIFLYSQVTKTQGDCGGLFTDAPELRDRTARRIELSDAYFRSRY